MSGSERKLRLVLKANAAFSLVNGVGLSLFFIPIAELMGVKNDAVLMFIGIALVLFSFTVFHAGFRKKVSSKQVWSIIVQDWAWVLGSTMIIGLRAWQLTSVVYWLIGAVALVVMSFAIGQTRFLKGH